MNTPSILNVRMMAMLLLVGLLSACTQTTGPNEAIPLRTGVPGDVIDPAETREVNAYRVKVGDRFSLNVFGEADVSGDFKVLEDGIVRHPLLGRVLVEGMSGGDRSTIYRALRP